MKGGFFMHQITEEKVAQFAQMLLKEERSPGTIENYLRHIRAFAQWLHGQEVTLEAVTTWKGNLLDKEYSPGSINAMLLALNRFFKFMGWNDCKVKSLRIQRQMFRETTKELTRKEYVQLLSTAQAQGKNRLVLLMEAICCTGIRVSEVQYLTVESVREGKAVISLKGKIRTILIPSKLRKKLLQFAQKQKNISGAIFRTRNGTPISRKQIWAEMKALCKKAGVAASKVFPHNLRHLFARTFYSSCKNVVMLADVLGHSSVETTRIYLISTGIEHEQQLEHLGLII